MKMTIPVHGIDVEIDVPSGLEGKTVDLALACREAIAQYQWKRDARDADLDFVQKVVAANRVIAARYA